jgi:hypothetical protein
MERITERMPEKPEAVLLYLGYRHPFQVGQTWTRSPASDHPDPWGPACPGGDQRLPPAASQRLPLSVRRH